MSVMPFAACSTIAFTAGSGECPVMPPVSPRHRSTYSMPSTSTNRAPCASRTNTGNGPAHSLIQGIGTPASRLRLPCSNSSAERG